MTSIKRIAAALTFASIAAFAFAQSQGFHFYGPYSRFVTGPSGTSNGHPAIFCFDNPALSGVTGEIFNLAGRQVDTFISNTQGSLVVLPNVCNQAGAFPGISMHYAVWDGKSNGAFVHSGIYVYRVRAEEKTYTGTLVVVK